MYFIVFWIGVIKWILGRDEIFFREVFFVDCFNLLDGIINVKVERVVKLLYILII